MFKKNLSSNVTNIELKFKSRYTEYINSKVSNANISSKVTNTEYM